MTFAAALDESVLALIDALPWPAMVVDDAGMVVHVNPELAAREAMQRNGIVSLQERFPAYYDALHGPAPLRHAQSVLVEISGPDGTVRERLHLRPIPGGACLIAVDETRLHGLETQHAQTVRLASLGFMLAGVCHEIANPLAAVHSMVQILQSQHDPELVQRGLASIARNIQRILEISRTLHGFSRVDGGPRVPVAVDTLVDDALGLARHEPWFAHVRVVHDRDAAAVVRCNPRELVQVFLNIINNAGHAMAGSGELHIWTQHDADGRVRVAIRDQGPGIGAEHLPRLFEPFFTTKPAGEGTGLGLAICNELIHGHGGTIRAESALGEGATFHVELPLHRRAGA